MISISTRSLAYRIGTRDILTDVTFSLEEGDRLAVVGVNGSGKSTLLRMLCGEYTPDEGEVYIAKEKVIGMLHQDDAFNVLSLDASNTIVDETVLGQIYAIFPDLCRAEMKLADLQRQLDEAPADDTELLSRLSAEYEAVNTRFIDGGGLHYKSRCRSILKDLGFGEEMFDMPVARCSGGQRTRLALARLLSREPDILILDEPTNHLDTETMEWLESHLSAYNPKKTIILVSHDRLFLDRVTNKTLDIEHTVGKLYKCGYSQYVIEKEAYRREWEKKYEIQQKEIARLEAYIEQQRRWNRERNIIAAESREKAIARMEKIDKPKDLPKSIRFALSSSGESGNDVAYARNLTMGFGDNILFRNLNFFRALVFLGKFKGFLEILIEFFHHMDPVGFSVFDFIKVLLHLCSEINVNNVGKMFGDKIDRNSSESGGFKGFSVFFNIVSADYGGDDRSIGGRTADSVFFKSLDERSLGES
jgi:ATP-binding cassette subfamily F protein 3